MPCRCDYMEPNEREIALSKVLTSRDEVMFNKKYNVEYARGMHPEAYGKGISQELLDNETAKLCSMLKILPTVNDKKITDYSLETQMWWRDHQDMDKRRIAKEAAAAKKMSVKEKALAKLTEVEKQALGL